MVMAFVLQDDTYTILADYIKTAVVIEDGSDVLAGSAVGPWYGISAVSSDNATVTIYTNRTVEWKWRVSEKRNSTGRLLSVKLLELAGSWRPKRYAR